MADAVTITLPLPDPAVSGNQRGHSRHKAAAVKAYRELSHGLTIQAVGRNRPRWESAVLTLRFYWPDNRRRDELNAAHGCKPAIDGMVDAGIITDDCWQVLRLGGIECGIDRANPRVELTIRKEAKN